MRRESALQEVSYGLRTSEPLDMGAPATGQGQPDYMAIMEAPPSDDAGPLRFSVYKVVSGDTISEIAKRYGISQDTIISFNKIQRARELQIGQELRIPNRDGLLYKVKKGDTLESIAADYSVSSELLLQENEGFAGISSGTVQPDMELFIPGAKMSNFELRKVWGELFRRPTAGWTSSRYGYRSDPRTGARRFHNGVDIANVEGTPVVAAMEGVVSEIGYNDNSGNYIILRHAYGYKTLYAHLSAVHVVGGQKVAEGERIGDMGNTGYSTGSHLHFSVLRNGSTIDPFWVMH